MADNRRETLNRQQQDYFRNRKLGRLAVKETPYVLNHLSRVLEAAAPSREDSILEIGAGLGRFTHLLDKMGYSVTANDLSPDLLESISGMSGGSIETLCCDIVDLPDKAGGKFDRVVGFFVLHHLRDLDSVFRSLAGILKPGGRVVFCEPNGLNFLYYLQIFFTPGMRFSQEPAIGAMKPGVLVPALERSGFVGIRSAAYGYFPPFLKNTGRGDRLERFLDERRFVPFPNAFRLVSATKGNG